MSPTGESGHATGETADEHDHEAFFQDVSDGCGCTEIWEYMSRRRRED